ncbi:hypothetical protein C8J57DRAFT_1494057 [Mycena rebaudengoi]|nr:hypothetical protein C8J57DRAFT_1494057 [Mycena rebaudengoi]
MPPINDGLAFFEKHVRHLSLDARPPFTKNLEVHSICTKVQNLATCGGPAPSFLPYVGRMRPRRLSVHAFDLFAGPPDFLHPVFPNVAHFDVVDGLFSTYDHNYWMDLASLPCLTHLSFNCYFQHIPDQFLRMLLKESQLLQTLILVVWDELEGESTYPTHDTRFVIAACRGYKEDWIRGAWGALIFGIVRIISSARDG